jgi:cyclic pyranopterin phosphate synthase
MSNFTHFNEDGRAKMVDVTGKEDTLRIAVARGEVKMRPETLAAIKDGNIKKGDVLAVAQVAGIMAAKQTSGLIPMCHPLFISGADIGFNINDSETMIEIQAVVKTTGKTGVEMEALTAVSIATLTIYDMCKAIDKDMVISEIRLVEKTGGKSGKYTREGENQWPEK